MIAIFEPPETSEAMRWMRTHGWIFAPNTDHNDILMVGISPLDRFSLKGARQGYLLGKFPKAKISNLPPKARTESAKFLMGMHQAGLRIAYGAILNQEALVKNALYVGAVCGLSVYMHTETSEPIPATDHNGRFWAPIQPSQDNITLLIVDDRFRLRASGRIIQRIREFENKEDMFGEHILAILSHWMDISPISTYLSVRRMCHG